MTEEVKQLSEEEALEELFKERETLSQCVTQAASNAGNANMGSSVLESQLRNGLRHLARLNEINNQLFQYMLNDIGALVETAEQSTKTVIGVSLGIQSIIRVLGDKNILDTQELEAAWQAIVAEQKAKRETKITPTQE